MKAFTWGLAATVSLTLAGSAHAGTILYKADQFDGDATLTDSFNGNGNLSVTTEGGPRGTRNSRAGGFGLTIDQINSFTAWCLDLSTSLSIPGTGRMYDETDTPFVATIGAIAVSRLDNVKSLFETAYATLDVTDNTQSAGFQLALWEILYEDGATLSLDDGTFSQTRAASQAANDQAQVYLDGLNGPVTGNYKLTFWESATDANGTQLSQNLVTVSAVPVPAGAALMLTGLGVFGAMGRKRASQA